MSEEQKGLEEIVEHIESSLKEEYEYGVNMGYYYLQQLQSDKEKTVLKNTIEELRSKYRP